MVRARRHDDSRPPIQARAITAEEGKGSRRTSRRRRLSVEGADVDISKVVLHWNNRPDETVTERRNHEGGRTDGSGGSAPGHEGTLGSVTVNYKILGDANRRPSHDSLGIRLSGYERRPAGQVAAINAPTARRSRFAFAGVEHGYGVHIPRARVARLRQTEASPPAATESHHAGDSMPRRALPERRAAGAPPTARRIAS